MSCAARGILPFAVMCVGMFVALLDIQIVASSLQDIGGGLSAAQDEIGWVQTSRLPSFHVRPDLAPIRTDSLPEQEIG